MSPSPDALLLIGPGCPHCAVVLEGLSVLVKEGLIGRLEVVNLEQRPDMATRMGVRTVPWTRLGTLEFEGAMSEGELRRWVRQADSREGLAAYYEQLLKNGQLARAERHLQAHPEGLHALIRLLGDADTGIHVRLGIGALLESGPERVLPDDVVTALGELTASDNPRIRADACHCLGCSNNPRAVDYLRPCLEDESGEVREIALEGLEKLGACRTY